MLAVVTPIRGSPAYQTRPPNVEIGQSKPGLQAGDIITHITRAVDRDGNLMEQPEIISTRGTTLFDAVRRIQRKAGTTVKLTVERDGFEKPVEFEITRGQVSLETVVGVKRNDDDSWNYALDPQKRIYYVRLKSFSNNTFRDLEQVLKELTKAGIKG